MVSNPGDEGLRLQSRLPSIIPCCTCQRSAAVYQTWAPSPKPNPVGLGVPTYHRSANALTVTAQIILHQVLEIQGNLTAEAAFAGHQHPSQQNLTFHAKWPCILWYPAQQFWGQYCTIRFDFSPGTSVSFWERDGKGWKGVEKDELQALSELKLSADESMKVRKRRKRRIQFSSRNKKKLIPRNEGLFDGVILLETVPELPA